MGELEWKLLRRHRFLVICKVESDNTLPNIAAEMKSLQNMLELMNKVVTKFLTIFKIFT